MGALAGKKAIVTGASSGIGTAVAGLVESNVSQVRFRGDQPPHVNVDELVVKALAQSSATRIIRES